MNFLDFYNFCKQKTEFSTTDKNEWGHTYITHYYNDKFTELRDTPIKLLEIGNNRGDSLRLFRGWFSVADIYGIEANQIIHDKETNSNVYVAIEEKYKNVFSNGYSESYVPGCKSYMMDAYIDSTLNIFDDESFDIIIDDGSHILEHQVYVVKNWIKKLKVGGTLIIEDIQKFEDCEELKKHITDNLQVEIYDLRGDGTTPDNIIVEIKKLSALSNTTSKAEPTISTEQIISTSDKKYKILLAQYYTSNLDYGKYSEELNRKYCAQHGYDYFVEKDDLFLRTIARDEEIALQWYKVLFLSKLLESHPNHDWVLFMDADAVISNTSRKIEEFCDDAFNVIVSTEEAHHCITNTGVILVKNNEWTRQFLKKWWEYRNKASGQEVNDILNWNGGMHRPENSSIFKSSLWHEQTCLTLMYKKEPEIQSNIKFIDNKIFNSHVYYPDGYIWHAFPYSFESHRHINLIHEARTSEFEKTEKVTVIYFIYCVNDYMERAKSDLDRLLQNGLYDTLHDMHVVASLPNRESVDEYNNLSSLYANHDKIKIHKVFDNKFEHYGITRVWIEAHKSDGPILYFHAKGVKGIYTNTNPHTQWKKEGDESFIEMLKYFMLDKHKDCIDKLKVYDTVNVSDSYSRGWPSGNFWWANKEYIRQNHFPYESTYDRWWSEAWINIRRSDYNLFQFYERFGFRDKFTFIPEKSYKNPKALMDKSVQLLSAKLMTLLEPENENDMNRPTSTNEVDVSDFIKSNLEQNNYKGFSKVIVSLHTLGNTQIEDKLPGTKKCLIIEFKISGDETVYRLAVDEGQELNYRIDKYNSIGYMFHENTKTVIDNRWVQ